METTQVIQTKKLARQCRFENCSTRAIFFNESTPKDIYCKTHSRPDMISNQVKCNAPRCHKQPSYITQNGERYCLTHKPKNAIDNKHEVCSFEPKQGQQSCTKRPSFGKAGQPKKYCKLHKEDDMLDVTNPKCTEKDCITRAYKGDSKCKKHSIVNKNPILEEYKVVEPIIPKKPIKYCQFEDCKKRPSFGLRDQQDKVMFCANHKSDLMVDIIHPRCQQNNCNIRAGFNFSDEYTSKYCDLHKYPGMVNVMHVNEICIHDDCKVRATFGLQSNRKRLYCTSHKLVDMISLDGFMCIYKECLTRASFNVPGDTIGKYCYHHKQQGMVGIKDRQCTNCDITARYDGLCSRCYYIAFPDNPQTRQFKTKELAVVKYLRDHIAPYITKNMVVDKMIQGGQGKYRPDILFDLQSHCLIVEINEFQHRSYDMNKEQERITQIYTDLQKRPLIIIKFNPDGYNTKHGFEQSPWQYCNRNKVDLINEQVWISRLNTLLKQINIGTINIPNGIQIEELYMDNLN